MVSTAIRTSALFRRIRCSHFVHEYIRPIYARGQMRAWWAQGRPAPPPHEVKLAAILGLADRLDAKALIETGSYLGDTIRALRGRFDLIASIEIAPSLAEPLQREFAGDSSVRVILGDSGAELSKLLAGNCSPPQIQTSVGSAVPARVRRMASRAPMARRRPVSTTERMSA
jgi:hypothetical protein